MSTITVRFCKTAQCDISLWYDTFGNPTNPPLVLIMGMNAQAIIWPKELCESLASLGFFVYRVENRDVGLSTHLDHLGTQSICCLACCGCCVTASYTIQDMAADILAFLDKMNLHSGVHLFAQSMGGMISQWCVHMQPERFASLTLLFTSPGAKSLPDPSLSTKLAMASAPKDDSREAYIQNFLKVAEAAFYTKEVLDANIEWVRDFCGAIYDRSRYMGMITRQASAVVAQEDRSEICKQIKIPTLILHGDKDVLVLPEHGRALAKLIPGSKYVEIKGMGHGLVPSFFDQITAPIVEIAGLNNTKKQNNNNNNENNGEAKKQEHQEGGKYQEPHNSAPAEQGKE